MTNPNNDMALVKRRKSDGDTAVEKTLAEFVYEKRRCQTGNMFANERADRIVQPVNIIERNWICEAISQ
ncbi:MAG: hypothetical protein WBM39_04555 [Parasphingorhabdus sp.]